MGDQLRAFKPPAPQAPQFLASKMHDFDVHYRSLNESKAKGNDASSDREENLLSPGKRIKIEEEALSSKIEYDRSIPEIKDESSAMDEGGSPGTAADVKPFSEIFQPGVSSFVLNPELEEIDEESTSSSSGDNSD